MKISIFYSIKLKCHGLSGSCSMKTCWMKLPPFTEIGSRLRDKYDVASKVTASNDGASFMTEDYEKPPTKRSLLYIEESPNFCKQNLKIGILGKYIYNDDTFAC